MLAIYPNRKLGGFCVGEGREAGEQVKIWRPMEW